MNPSCHFKEWSSHDARQLLKMKGTIQDVDGDCSIKLTGLRNGCPIAAHYRLPLYALNKKFGIYRKVVEHLWNASGVEAIDIRNTYLSEDSHIRSTETSDQQHWTITFGWITLLMGSMMIVARPCMQLMELPSKVSRTANVQIYLCFIFDWKTYHNSKCKEQDSCGALQGCGGGEDIESLLSAVDASITAEGDQMGSKAFVNVPASGPSATQMMVVLDDPHVENPFPKFPLPFDLNCRSMALSTLGGYARQVLIGGFGRWLPSHIVM
ncbi:hypothetical protein C8R48DRAFT_774727 [Suillus tomentosus]|nr:hypothetical protein C8R48DRAFT_774727 [Suillus tomentosus]